MTIEGTPTSPRLLSFSDLMARVGYLLFYWSGLEQELSSAVRTARERLGRPSGRVCGSFAERLDTWCELVALLPEHAGDQELAREVKVQALELRGIRNLIVHGLERGSSMPAQGPARIHCAVGGYDNPTGKVVTYSIEDLEHFAQAADACRRAFSHLHAFNYRLAEKRAV